MIAKIVFLSMFTLIPLCALLVGIFVLKTGLKNAFVGVRIRSQDRERAKSTEVGSQMNVQGTAKQHENTLRAPLSGEECLGYELVIEHFHSSDSGTGGGNWLPVGSVEKVTPFILESDTKTVLVSEEGPDLSLIDDETTVTVSPNEDPPEDLRRFLDRNDPFGGDLIDRVVRKLSGLFSSGRRRYRENVLKEDETAYVSGVVRAPTEVPGSVPRQAAAVVGSSPEEQSGVVGAFSKPWTPAFFVADSSKDESAKRHLLKGGALTVFGLIFTGIGIIVPAYVMANLL